MSSRRVNHALFILCLFVGLCHAEEDRTRQWLERPWEIRYVVFFTHKHGMSERIRVASKWNARNKLNGEELVYFSAMALFTPDTLHATSRLPVDMTLLTFDMDGHVSSALLSSAKWTIKRNLLDHIVLIDPAQPRSKPYYLADWSQGIPGDKSFSPAICSGWDDDRYRADWGIDDRFGNFGCREWTAQLYRDDQPYIDVTSYSSSRPFIGEFIGWSRFSDPPKPVIGLQDRTWFCLHDCPKDEKPGAIRDIKTWTKKHGFPMPERPPKQPLYPNSDYLDDIHEFKD